MKKIISISLILTIFLMLALTAIPAAAESSTTELPISNWSKPWLNETGWTKVETYEDLINAFKSDKIDEYKNGTGGKIYLANDITVGNEPMYTAGLSQTNFIFDGNGKSLIFTEDSESVFNNLADVTIRNLKLIGNFTADSEKDRNSCSPLGSEKWNYTGKVTLQNIVSELDIMINNNSIDKAVGGILQHAGAGSSFENVVFSGSIRFADNEAYVGAVGGILGYTKGDGITFTNCRSEGIIILDNGEIISGKDESGIGGFVGSAVNKISFEDCTNACEIKASGLYAAIGGFVGVATAEVSFNGCTNDASITHLNAKYNDCPYRSNATNAYRGIGGFIGILLNNGVNTFTDCVNSEKGTITHSTTHTAVNGMAGFIGNVDGESGNRTELSVVFDKCANFGDIVNGSFADAKNTLKASNDNVSRGGFVGLAKSALKYSFTDCINAGNVVNGENDAGGTGSYESAGGFIGLERFGGFGGMAGKKGYTKLKNCVNLGDIKAVNSAGGFIGKNFEIRKGTDNKDDSYDFSVTFEKCLNLGDITAPYAGGLFGIITESSGFGGAYISLSIWDSANGGEINGVNAAGGIVGYARFGTVNINNCVNGGKVNADLSAAGIVGNNESGEILDTGKVIGNVSVDISGCINVGKIECSGSNFNPMGTGMYTYSDNVFYEDSLEDTWFDEADADTIENIGKAIEKLDLFVSYGFDILEDEIELAEKYAQRIDEIGEDKWSAYEAAVREAKNVLEVEIVTRDTDGILAIMKQSELNRAYFSLVEARNALGVTLTPDKPDTPENPDDSPVEPTVPAAPGSTDDEDSDESPKPPVTTEAPTEAPKVSTEVPEKESGCGSTIGSAAVALVVVTSLGVGASLRKKD